MSLQDELARAGWLEEIYNRDKGLCHICGDEPFLQDLTFDHIIPSVYGGLTVPWNLRVAHRSCNQSRGAGRLPGQIQMPIMDLETGLDSGLWFLRHLRIVDANYMKAYRGRK